MRVLVVTFAIGGITACHSPARSDDFVPFGDASTLDAAPDAPCGSGRTRYPITATGSTPSGSATDYHYAEASYDCNWYTVIVSHTMAGSSCSSDRWMYITFDFPRDAMQPGSGSFPAAASEYDRTISADALDATAQISFEATLVDPPPLTNEAHLVGHFVANADWSLDLAIDLVAPPGLGSCTL